MSTTPYPGRHRYPQSPLLSLEPKQNRRSVSAVALVSAGLMAVGVTTGAGQLSSGNPSESSLGAAAVAGSANLLALDSSSATTGTAPSSPAAATAATLASAGLSAAQEAAVQRDVADAAAALEARAAVTRRARAAAAAHAAQVAKAAKAAAAAKAAKAATAASSGDSVPASGSARDIGRALAAARGWGDAQFQCLNKLWTKESNWSVSADNPSSSAYGIPQALPGSKMASAGPNWRTNAATQITWGLKYIASRYGTPCAAWGHSVSHNWY